MRSEQTGIENKKFKLYQVKEAVFDPKTWILFITTFCLHFVNGSVSGFGAVIIRSFGYSPLKSILLIGAVGACVFVTLLCVGLVGTYVPNTRTLLIAICEIPVIIGSSLVWKEDWTSNRGAAIAGFIMIGTFAAGYMMILALMAANTAGHTKKAFTSSLLWCAWSISNGVSPLTVKTTEALEHYPTCFKATIATAALTITGALVLRFYLQKQNSIRDRKFGDLQDDDGSSEAFHDHTDMENECFRFLLCWCSLDKVMGRNSTRRL